MLNIHIPEFISEKVTKRKSSLFSIDIDNYEEELSSQIKGNSVLVIGGAGTIGSSFIKAILNYYPSSLIVVDTNENGLTELTRDLRSTHELKVPEQYLTYPMSFDDPLFYRLLEKEDAFDIIANFAAHKHVRSEKDIYSISALIENNVIKYHSLLKKLLKKPPKHFFCVSTDKAANPVNIMGASKKIMEELIIAYSSKFKITTARFANVAFSNGSLLDGFISRVIKRQPLTAPLDIKRYFVSPEESGQICLLSCVLGESGDIFFPKLKSSQMLSFSDISNDFLSEIGFDPLKCSSEKEAKAKAKLIHNESKSYPVFYFKSDTSGEKSFEEFFTKDEDLEIDKFFNLGIVKNKNNKSIIEVEDMIYDLKHKLSKKDISKNDIVCLLTKILPNFKHIETGKSLDQKM